LLEKITFFIPFTIFFLMDPLLKVKEAYNKGILPKEEYSLIL